MQKNGSIWNCRNCSDYTVGCISCSQSYGLIPTCYNCTTGDAINGVCQTTSNCNSTQYDANALLNSPYKKCVDCPTSCKTCKINSTNDTLPSCLTCISTDYTLMNYNGIMMCTLNCQVGSFLNFATKSCQYCKENCKACNNIGSCTECKVGYDLKSGSCITKQIKCPRYSVLNSAGTCQCNKGYVLQKNQTTQTILCVKAAVAQCTKGKFFDSNSSQCTTCRAMDD